jgi:SAM-dependent methyltransferase
MSSVRRTLAPEDNIHGSKNTRMDVAGPLASWKPDEIGHITRYTKIADMVIKEAKRLGRPLNCFEVGCGNIWVLRHIYKSIVIRKSDVIRSYDGYDIDPAVLDEFPGWPSYPSVNDSAWLKTFGGTVHIKDVTVSPNFREISDGYDFFWTTEVIEHMHREFVEPWLKNAARCLRKDGLAYISTPNHDGSNDKLPVDHIYEWGHEELRELLSKYFNIIQVHGVFTQVNNFNRMHKEEGRWPDHVIEDIRMRFSPEFQRVILATAYPESSNNAAFVLRKKYR